MAPCDQFLTAVVLVDSALDQGWASLVVVGSDDSLLELAGGVGDEGDTVAVGGVEGLHQQGVVPVLDLVVAAVVDLDLDGVAAVVDQQDGDRQVEADHLGDLLGGHLEGTVTADADGAALGVAHGVAKRGGHRPADVAPLHLDLVACAPWEVQLCAVEPGVAGLDEEGGVGGDEGLQLALDLLAGELLLVAGLVDDVGVGAEALVLDHGGIIELDLSGEVLEELAEADTAEVVAGEGDMVHVALHQGDVGHGGPANGGVVVEDAAGADDGVGPVEDGVGGEGGDLAPEDTNELGVVLWEHALGSGLEGNCAAHGLGKLDEGLVSTASGQLRADEDQRLELAPQVFGGAVGGGGEGALVGDDGLGDGGDGAGADTGGTGQVGGNLDVARLPGQDGGADGSVDESGGLLGAVDGDGATCDLLGHLKLVVVVELAEGVVQQVELAGVVRVWGTGDEDQGQVLGVGTAGTVEGGDGADRVGDDAGRDAVGTGVALGGHAAVELIGTTDLLEVRVGLELVEEDEVVVARHDKVVSDADLGQPLGEVVTDGELSRCARHWEGLMWVCWGR